VQTIDTGFYDANQMKQPKNIEGENRWSNGTYSDSLVNKNNVKFSIKDKLAIEATLTISPTSGTWVYYPANISGNVISYTNARGRIAYEDLDTILKETIVLNAPVSSITWILNLSVKPQSLGFSVDADGYSIRDPANTDQRIHIPFPYVTDANGVKRTLSYSWNNGQRRVTLNQDFAGLTYPLTIDPVYVVDTTGYTGQWPIMLVNQSNYPQIIYASSTTSRIKLAVNNSGIITTASIGPATYFSGYQPMGAIINKTNDLPIVIYPGTATGNSINVTWFTNNWLGQEVNNFIAIGQKYGRLPAGQGKTNELLFANMNGSYGPFNITQVSGLSGSPPLTAKNYSILWQQLYRPIYSGKMNATNTLNIIWVLQTKINWTTVTDDNPPGLSTLVLSSGAINVSVAENGGMLMDINPITGFPGYSFIPATSSSGSTTGRAINYSYFDGTHWFYETAYENVTVGGMSST
jgi:hypothetical protein